MMTVLMLAFEFPPLGGIGVQRSLKLAKYWPEHGVRPVVVAPDQESLERVIGPAKEAALLNELPSSVRVERVPCPPLRPTAKTKAGRWLRNFFRVGEELGSVWRSALLAALPEIIQRERPAAVYVSVPPFSMAPLALEVARRFDLPLCVDFRDHWSHWGSDPHPSWLHYRVVKAREGRVLRGAAAVTGVTRQLVSDLSAAHPQVSHHHLSVVHNGFDGGDDLAGAMPTRAGTRERPFVIGYVGSFYYTPRNRESILSAWWQRPPSRWLHYAPRREDWLYRSPYFLFRALGHLFGEHPELRERVRVRFVGDTPDWLREQVRAAGLTDIVEHLGRMPHRACLEFQATCDALLVTSAKVLGAEDYCIAGKTFEYVAARRPVVGFVTPGAQRWFLENSGLAVVSDPDDVAAAAGQLAALVEGRLSFAPNLDFLRQFHRRETAREMAGVLRRIVLRPAAEGDSIEASTIASARN